ncbi:hypothetical protein OA88_22835 [Flavobacterium sp. JRM]|nr:hypothetical protein OA88_22835 [Flavobacterium sp. JRM]
MEPQLSIDILCQLCSRYLAPHDNAMAATATSFDGSNDFCFMTEPEMDYKQYLEGKDITSCYLAVKEPYCQMLRDILSTIYRPDGVDVMMRYMFITLTSCSMKNWSPVDYQTAEVRQVVDRYAESTNPLLVETLMEYVSRTRPFNPMTMPGFGSMINILDGECQTAVEASKAFKLAGFRQDVEKMLMLIYKTEPDLHILDRLENGASFFLTRNFVRATEADFDGPFFRQVSLKWGKGFYAVKSLLLGVVDEQAQKISSMLSIENVVKILKNAMERQLEWHHVDQIYNYMVINPHKATANGFNTFWTTDHMFRALACGAPADAVVTFAQLLIFSSPTEPTQSKPIKGLFDLKLRLMTMAPLYCLYPKLAAHLAYICIFVKSPKPISVTVPNPFSVWVTHRRENAQSCKAIARLANGKNCNPDSGRLVADVLYGKTSYSPNPSANYNMRIKEIVRTLEEWGEKLTMLTAHSEPAVNLIQAACDVSRERALKLFDDLTTRPSVFMQLGFSFKPFDRRVLRPVIDACEHGHLVLDVLEGTVPVGLKRSLKVSAYSSDYKNCDKMFFTD